MNDLGSGNIIIMGLGTLYLSCSCSYTRSRVCTLFSIEETIDQSVLCYSICEREETISKLWGSESIGQAAEETLTNPTPLHQIPHAPPSTNLEFQHCSSSLSVLYPLGSGKGQSGLNPRTSVFPVNITAG